jgi:glycosyltransferase involved in cell wall biosynthesis
MRIAWYTPFSVHSAIGRFSSLVVKALRELAVEVQVVRSESKTAAMRFERPACDQEKWIWAADLQRNPAHYLRNYDLVVYNVGDHYDYHTYCFQHQPLAPGLTILHDYCLHHALYQHCQRSIPTGGDYRGHLQTECGSEATRIYDRLLESGSSQLWWHYELARFPVNRWAIQDTLGVVTHAEFYRQAVARGVGCPTTCIPLAYDTPVAANREPTGQPSDKLTILTVGAVNSNKRHEAVIRAMAESPLLRQRCHYRIVGTADAAQRQMIQMALSTYTQPPRVSLTGRVSRETLRDEIASADIISCLRFPTLEGASASVVEGLLSGKPVVVCETGCYQEIPDDVVFKVSPQHEHSQLTQALEHITNDYPSALRRANAAQQWAAPRHAPGAYAQAFRDFAQRVLYNRPVVQLADRIAHQLRKWSAHPDACLFHQVDQAMLDLFGRQARARRAA